MYKIYTVSLKLLSYQDVFKHMHVCILSQAVLIMHNPAWAVLMFKTLARGRGKKTQNTLIYSFVSESSNKNKLKEEIRIEQGRKKTCVALLAPQGKIDLWFVHVL